MLLLKKVSIQMIILDVCTIRWKIMLMTRNSSTMENKLTFYSCWYLLFVEVDQILWLVCVWLALFLLQHFHWLVFLAAFLVILSLSLIFVLNGVLFFPPLSHLTTPAIFSKHLWFQFTHTLFFKISYHPYMNFKLICNRCILLHKKNQIMSRIVYLWCQCF